MSTHESTPTTSLPGAATLTRSALATALARPASALLGTVRALSFWFAALAPLACVPLLAAGVAGDHPLAFAGFLVATAVAMVGGHAHHRPA